VAREVHGGKPLDVREDAPELRHHPRDLVVGEAE
jgi:hypothetical protein